MATKDELAKSKATIQKALQQIPKGEIGDKLRSSLQSSLANIEAQAKPAVEAEQAVGKQIGLLEQAIPGARRSLLAQQAGQRGQVLANLQRFGRGADAARQLRAFETQATGQLAGQDFQSRLAMLQAISQAKQQQFANQQAIRGSIMQQQALQAQQEAARPTFGKFLGSALGTTVGALTGGLGAAAVPAVAGGISNLFGGGGGGTVGGLPLPGAFPSITTPQLRAPRTLSSPPRLLG